MGERTHHLEWLPIPQPRTMPEGVSGEIMYCDTYGNLISNIPAALLEGRQVAEVRIRGRSIRRLNRTFHDGNAPGTLVALFGSHGYLEVAVANGNAADALDVGPGEPLTVTFAAS